MKPQEDILGRTPQVGDTIIWNPAKYKGLVHGICMGISKSGLPEVEPDEKFNEMNIGYENMSGYYTPKTGFVSLRSSNETVGMGLQCAIEILEYHQQWRLNKRSEMIHDPKKLSEAIDIILSEVKRISTSK